MTTNGLTAEQVKELKKQLIHDAFNAHGFENRLIVLSNVLNKIDELTKPKPIEFYEIIDSDGEPVRHGRYRDKAHAERDFEEFYAGERGYRIAKFREVVE